MGHIEPMTASEICYRYSSVLDDSVRDRLWGERDRRRGEVNAIMDALGLKEAWEGHVSTQGSGLASAKAFATVHLEGMGQQDAMLSRCAEIERLSNEWSDFYYGLKKIVKGENQKQGSEN